MAVTIDVVPWVHHEGQTIYSLDVDHKGRRAVTAGFDSCSRVWSLAPILSASAENDEGHNLRLLATLSGHYSPVNTARFANHSNLIATCSDDKHIFIYELLPGPGQAAFGEKPNHENWKNQHTLRGHSNNVVDVEWSPDDSLLASCSLDNLVVIWTSSGKQVTALKSHSSYVKGIAWDPVGSFLASQSDDKSIIIWRCSDWTSVQQITEPFQKGMILETFSLRLRWSTDGGALLAVNSLQRPAHCASVLNREKWDAPLHVVGHRGAVTVVRFNPVMFENQEEGNTEPVTCFALGAQDQKVTVWLGSGTRPVVILKGVFTQSLTDLAWTPDGHSLLASSSSGAVAVFRFERGTFGKPLTKAAQEKHIQELYGSRTSAQPLLLESSLLLNVAQNGKASTANQGMPAKGSLLAQPLKAGTAALPGTDRLGLNAIQNPINQSRKQAARQDTRETTAGPPAKVRRVTPEMTNGVSNPGSRHSLGKTAATGPSFAGRSVWPVPQPQKLAIVDLGVKTNLAGPASSVRLEIENLDNAARIVCTHDGTTVWQDQVKAPVLCAAGNLSFATVALLDGSLIVYSAAGRRRLPTIALGLPCTHLCAGKDMLLVAVQLDGTLHLWDLQEGRLNVKSAVPSIQNIDVASVKLTERGRPQVILADGSAYVLDLDLQAWLCVVDPTFAFTAFASLLPDTSAKAGELGQMEREASAAGQAAAFASNATPFTASDSSRRHLESQVASALALESPQEYRRWLLTYVRHLAGEQSEAALSEVMTPLLGPIRRSDASPWQETILGISKHGLLREILRELYRHRTMQRLVTRYIELLDESEKPPP